MIRLRNVSYRYSALAGVDGVSFEINPGDFILLVGKTGAGKTTVIKLISLELFPEKGEVSLERFSTAKLRQRDFPKWRRRVGIVFQDFRLLQDRSALENVRLAAYCEPTQPGSPKSRALRALASVGMSHRVHNLPSQLSAGEQQRTAIARALVNNPFVLLADEPVSNLDSETSHDVIEQLSRVNKSGMAMLVATHQPERFELLHPRVIRLDGGRMVEM